MRLSQYLNDPSIHVSESSYKALRIWVHERIPRSLSKIWIHVSEGSDTAVIRWKYLRTPRGFKNFAVQVLQGSLDAISKWTCSLISRSLHDPSVDIPESGVRALSVWVWRNNAENLDLRRKTCLGTLNYLPFEVRRMIWALLLREHVSEDPWPNEGFTVPKVSFWHRRPELLPRLQSICMIHGAKKSPPLFMRVRSRCDNDGESPSSRNIVNVGRYSFNFRPTRCLIEDVSSTINVECKTTIFSLFLHFACPGTMKEFLSQVSKSPTLYMCVLHVSINIWALCNCWPMPLPGGCLCYNIRGMYLVAPYCFLIPVAPRYCLKIWLLQRHASTRHSSTEMLTPINRHRATNMWLNIFADLPAHVRSVRIGFGKKGKKRRTYPQEGVHIEVPGRLRRVQSKIWLLEQIISQAKSRAPGAVITMGDWNYRSGPQRQILESRFQELVA